MKQQPGRCTPSESYVGITCMQLYPSLLAVAILGATLSSSGAQAPPQKFEPERIESVKKG
jgi:hypothetical protein